VRRLDVFMGGVLVGMLCEHPDGRLEFSYDAAWLAGGQTAPLSPILPLGERVHAGEAVVAYFDNLLPEGSVRDFIARVEHISPGNVFGWLERFGGDTAGALSLLPQGQVPSAEPRYLPVTVEAIREWFNTSRGIPLDMTGGQARMSLSGTQDKMSVFVDDGGALAIPLGDAPSSHIIKPSMGYRPDIPHTAINEALVMMLAKAVGLDVPEVRFVPELDAVLIARYDRQRMPGGPLQRLHQNDLCQIMGIATTRKYESEGGPSLKACFETVLQYSHQPARDKKRLIEWVIFNLLVGNMDSHAKNISLLTVDGRTRLAPFYDLVCTIVYPHLSRKFAFKIGGENRPEWIRERHWARFADEIGVKARWVDSVRETLLQRIEGALQGVADTLSGQVNLPEGRAMIDRLDTEIQRMLKRFSS